MKLIFAIVNNDDSAIAAAALTKEGFFVTKLSTTGGFLMVGNTTFLIGTQDGEEDQVLKILSDCCATRSQTNPSTVLEYQKIGHGTLTKSFRRINTNTGKHI